MPATIARPDQASEKVLAGARPHCLLVTFLSLTRLSHRSSGSSRRLAMLLDGVRQAGLDLRICCSLPYEDSADPRAAEQRIVEQVKAAWDIDATVVAAPSSSPSQAPWILQQVAATFGYSRNPALRSRISPDLHRALAACIAERPALVLAHRLPAMQALAALGVPVPTTIFDLDDIEHVAALRAARQSSSLRTRTFGYLAIPGLIAAERAALRRASSTLVCSRSDADLLARQFPGAAIEVVPNALPLPAAVTPLSRSRTLLMVAAYDYDPNAHGANTFIRDVFPLIRARVPDATVEFVGAAPECIAAYSSRPPGVTFSGFVPDLEPAYARARAVICPVYYGGGTRVKLVEASARGKPMVSTTVGAEGLGLVDGTHALIGDTPQAFADACVRVLEDDALCTRLGADARALATEQFDAARVARNLGARWRQQIAH